MRYLFEARHQVGYFGARLRRVVLVGSVRRIQVVLRVFRQFPASQADLPQLRLGNAVLRLRLLIRRQLCQLTEALTARVVGKTPVQGHLSAGALSTHVADRLVVRRKLRLRLAVAEAADERATICLLAIQLLCLDLVLD